MFNSAIKRETANMKITLSKGLAASAMAIALFAAVAWQGPAGAQAAPLAEQTTVEQGVTVKVTPRTFSGSEWEFAVVLDTHSQELNDDLQKTAVLIVDGREVRPVEWQGPGAGGHHREGTLRFPAAGEKPGNLELRIQRSGEAVPRVFRWDAAAVK